MGWPDRTCAPPGMCPLPGDRARIQDDPVRILNRLFAD
jgi:hypothetical protein